MRQQNNNNGGQQRKQNNNNNMNNPERNNGAAANDNSQPKVTPTGIPRAGPLVLPAESVLKSLQVKAELAKLGQPPRAYVEKIQML